MGRMSRRKMEQNGVLGWVALGTAALVGVGGYVLYTRTREWLAANTSSPADHKITLPGSIHGLGVP